MTVALRSSKICGLVFLEGFPSGQRGQTVNLLVLPSEVRILPPPPDANELPSALTGEDESLRRNIQGGGSTIVIESRAGSDFERAWRGRVERGGGQEVWSNPPPPPKKLNEDYSCT